MERVRHLWRPRLGSFFTDEGVCQFRVWAPFATQVDLHLLGEHDRYLPMERDELGYYRVAVDDIGSGQTYLYRLDGEREHPDPASRYQPEGVFGPSQVVTLPDDWRDDEWRGVPLQEYIIYELHIGTFSQEGTFLGAIQHLDRLAELGVTAIEIMPVSQFSGRWGWGYDGVYPFAVHNTYGTPEDFKELIDACHERGLAVILDVVYNHLGPEGNYLREFGPYTTDRYRTPWGEAMNFDGPYNDEVRTYFIENALYWIHEYHIDGLRLDATHFIIDLSAVTFLEDLISAVHEHRERLNRKIYLIAENDRNDPMLTRSRDLGGYGMDAQWNDDFHHALHTLITNETFEYYQGFGTLEHLVKGLREGFIYSGQYSPYRKARHGASSATLPAERFVVFTQNHDQIGNRMPSQRLCQFVSFPALKLAAGIVFLSPYVPMLFMGEEYHEQALFNFFTDFSDEALIEAVREGRKQEFGSLLSEGFEPPDPQAESTFLESKLTHDLNGDPKRGILFDFHRELFALRQSLPALYDLRKAQMDVLGYDRECLIYVRRWSEDDQVFMAFNFNESPSTVVLPVPSGTWFKCIDSADPQWRADKAGSDDNQMPEDSVLASTGQLKVTVRPQSFIVYRRQ